ncbi:hypothetical protein EV360DRAFT_72024 [Lentinula raphanica]|nr:hypothetical protein EV360DRAFT_72024 [Lentinula raphanica]
MVVVKGNRGINDSSIASICFIASSLIPKASGWAVGGTWGMTPTPKLAFFDCVAFCESIGVPYVDVIISLVWTTVVLFLQRLVHTAKSYMNQNYTLLLITPLSGLSKSSQFTNNQPLITDCGDMTGYDWI